MTDAQRTRLTDALDNLRQTSWDYYDGDNVWCRFCQANRPSPDHDNDLSWHDSLCIYRVTSELWAAGAFPDAPTSDPKPAETIRIVDMGD